MRIQQTILAGLLFLATIGYAQKNVFLDRAYWKGNPSIEDIDQKIAEGNNITALNGAAFDAVTWALIEKADNKTVKYLLSKKGNGVNKLTHDGRTYIFWAAYRDNLEMMEYLVDKGAKTDIIDSHGYSVLNFAATTGQLNTKLYDFCIKHGADPKTEKNHSGANALLLVAPFIKDMSLIKYFTSKGIDVNSTDNDGNGIFNYAAKTGNIELMNFLVKQGLSYKKPNKKGGNAMIFASRGTRNKKNTLETYQYLEKLGIAPNVVTNDGITPLHSIAYRGKDMGIYKYFLSKGVDVNQADGNGNTPFLNSTLMNDVKIISMLSKHVKNINTQNKDGKTALTNAIQRNSPEVVNFLIEKGADVHVTDKKGNNLGYYLVRSYSPRKVDDFKQKVALVSKKGFDITKNQKDGNSLFHIALESDNLDLLKWVHKIGVNVNTKNKDGLTPLHQAAMTAKDDTILKYLLSIGANKGIKTDFDESVYALAAENELLQKNNIDIQFLK